MNRKKIYDVALSFAGEDRAFVSAVAHRLRELGISVFYDEFEQSSLWGKDLYSYLVDLYMKRARYCVMFLSQYYAAKPWPKHERKAAQAKALLALAEYILPVRLDDTEIPGILPTTAYVSAKRMNPEQVAELIAEKVANPVLELQALDSNDLIWDWGDWLPFANEFISQHPVRADELRSIMGKAGLDVPDFIGHGVAAIVSFEVAEQYCELLGGRLPNVESLKYLSSIKPPLLRADLGAGWYSDEWTRSVAEGDDLRYVITTVDAGTHVRYFTTKVGSLGPKGDTASFRVAVLKPPRPVKREAASHSIIGLLADPRKSSPR